MACFTVIPAFSSTAKSPVSQERHTHTHTHFKAIKAIPMHLSSYSDTRIPTRDALVTDSSVMNDSVGPQTFIKVKMTESVKLRQ